MPAVLSMKDDELENSSSKPLLPTRHHHSSSSWSRTKLFLVWSTCVALSVVVAFGCFFFSESSSSVVSITSHHVVSKKPPSSKLKHPVVLLISCDGFRFGYQFKTDTPNIDNLIKTGTAAKQGLIPVFPTLTFPNHYSIATGLYPAHHGIINNKFSDPITGDKFTTRSREPKWWLGEPIWETVANHGLKASTYFWPGSEVTKGSWDCPKGYCMPYNASVPFVERVDTILNYFDLPSDDMIPSLMTLYLEDPDSQGHKVGPDHPSITAAIANVDTLVGRMIRGLKKKGVYDDVHIILLGDHGMVGTCDQRLVFLDDLAEWIKIPAEWVQSYTPLLAIRPPANYSLADVVAKMNAGLKSGKVNNGEYLQVYLKEDLPTRLHYSASDRIPPIIGLAGEGFKIEQTRTDTQQCAGSHGYDNTFFSMRTIFFGRGPRFPKGKTVASFENVQVYNVITDILNIRGAPNNGTASFPMSLLLPRH